MSIIKRNFELKVEGDKNNYSIKIEKDGIEAVEFLEKYGVEGSHILIKKDPTIIFETKEVLENSLLKLIFKTKTASTFYVGKGFCNCLIDIKKSFEEDDKILIDNFKEKFLEMLAEELEKDPKKIFKQNSFDILEEEFLQIVKPKAVSFGELIRSKKEAFKKNLEETDKKDYFYSKNAMWLREALRDGAKFKYLDGDILSSFYDLITVEYLDVDFAIPVPVLVRFMEVEEGEIYAAFSDAERLVRNTAEFWR